MLFPDSQGYDFAVPPTGTGAHGFGLSEGHINSVSEYITI